VGTKPPNELGIYDLSGNAPTLLWDPVLYSQVSGGNSDFTAAAVTNPKGTNGKYDRRAVRGGGYHSGDVCNFSVARHFKSMTATCAFSFRLARSN
jgi:formylglycine-generating enzyme required for sulfatase activity